MSQAPMTLQTTLAHKPFAWRRWLIILVITTVISGGLWWAKETGRLDSLLADRITTNIPINTAPADNTVATANNNAGAAQSPAEVNTTTANQSQTTIKTTERAAQPATTSAAVTSTDTAVDTETAVSAASRSLVAVAGIDGVQVWNAEGQLLTTLDIGAKLQATARTADGQWLTVEAENATGWAQATQVVAFDLADLPVTTLAAPVTTASTQPLVATEAATTEDNNAPVTAATQPATPAADEASVANTVNAKIKAIVTTSGANLNVRSGPATTYTLVIKVANGATVTVVGRDESGTWLQIQFATATADTGWVMTQYLQVDSALDGLPVVTTVTD